MFSQFRTVVRREWTAGGHLSAAGFLAVFDQATDCLRINVGLAPLDIHDSNCGLYVVEAHIAFERELHEGDVVGVDTMVLGVDTKKLHLLHQMHRESSSVSSAAVEMLILNVDRDSGRTVPIPETPLLQLRNLAAAHSREPAPSMIGRVITFHRAK